MYTVGVVGSTGYSGQELVHILARHTGVSLECITARFDEEVKYSDVYPEFAKITDLTCEDLDIDKISAKCDLVFVALPHTVSVDVVPRFLEKGIKVIDLSADYRLPADVYEKWYAKEHSDKENIDKAVYGLPEIYRDDIKEADLIANPGCYPTGIILALAPVIKQAIASGSKVIIDAKSGVTGAGRKAAIPLLYSELAENFKCYKANEHQHMPEINSILSKAADTEVNVTFVPHLLPVKRGILSTIYIDAEGMPSEEELVALYKDKYGDEPFVRVREAGVMPELKDVVGTNFCDIGIKVAGGMLIIVAVIDNLLKGASGQAVQNMNIMFGLDEKTGL